MKDGKKVVKQLIFEIGLNINLLCFADKRINVTRNQLAVILVGLLRTETLDLSL